MDDGDRAGLRQAPRLLPSRAAARGRCAVLAGHRLGGRQPVLLGAGAAFVLGAPGGRAGHHLVAAGV
ncbi:hypothetical protein, partial [Streptomyces albus]|uniref:hypothetical protein n=1 Tax=Streptomyces sp. PHES57 TaxID=2872626 RepID=UPI001CEC8F75